LAFGLGVGVLFGDAMMSLSAQASNSRWSRPRHAPEMRRGPMVTTDPIPATAPPRRGDGGDRKLNHEVNAMNVSEILVSDKIVVSTYCHGVEKEWETYSVDEAKELIIRGRERCVNGFIYKIPPWFVENDYVLLWELTQAVLGPATMNLERIL
jgi:hypothetical protein